MGERLEVPCGAKAGRKLPITLIRRNHSPLSPIIYPPNPRPTKAVDPMPNLPIINQNLQIKKREKEKQIAHLHQNSVLKFLQRQQLSMLLTQFEEQNHHKMNIAINHGSQILFKLLPDRTWRRLLGTHESGVKYQIEKLNPLN
ncbi:hypothetical protein L6164_005878 [Bauhinia variegata]|uniref:Uncharacterized protein n=1 Tax=Bauhinia variegata TaxID=167791 RepID=A0ACB9PUR5_BAUVA|nr:hypothetical protein L6164_005878 [Bauhinia variegata]